MSQLTPKTWVPLGAVAGAAGTLIGVGIWVGGIQLRITSVEAAVEKVDARQEEAMKEFRGMNLSLGKILGELRALRGRGKVVE